MLEELLIKTYIFTLCIFRLLYTYFDGDDCSSLFVIACVCADV